MKVRGLNGREYNLNLARSRIDWDRKVSGPQKAVKDFLRPYWNRIGVVATEETVLPGCGRALRMDLINWNRRIAIEVSPQSSHSFNQFFHKSRVGFSAAVKRDLDKELWCKANGFNHFVELGDDDIPLLSPAWFLEHYDITL